MGGAHRIKCYAKHPVEEIELVRARCLVVVGRGERRAVVEAFARELGEDGSGAGHLDEEEDVEDAGQREEEVEHW